MATTMRTIKNAITRRTSTMQLQQERLVLLHHARKCPHEEDCPVTPNCAETKRLWKHIAQCKNKKCSHCYSWRYVLTHFRECKDETCPICGPVREVIRRTKEEKKQRQQGHAIMRTDTFSTSMTTGLSFASTRDELFYSTPSTSTPEPNNNTAVAVSPITGPMPTLTVAICRSVDNVGRLIPVRVRSFSSLSTISQSSGAFSNRSSAPSSRSGGSYSGRIRYSGCQHPNCGGIKCRENLGIAHFGNEGSGK
mmetsp:Transcript_33018/g.79887  ORF Transcript_33018/g.79887 Transcript_33018/m.79887 type:complete len:251 (+) Transcript_33018:67-819(+)